MDGQDGGYSTFRVNIIALPFTHFALEEPGTHGIHVTPTVNGDNATVSIGSKSPCGNEGGEKVPVTYLYVAVNFSHTGDILPENHLTSILFSAIMYDVSLYRISLEFSGKEKELCI